MQKVKISTEDLQTGMYVSNLDRPWLETPFLFQGFPINSQEEIEQLQRYCQYVYIDVELGVSPQRDHLELIDAPELSPVKIDKGVRSAPSNPPSAPLLSLHDEITQHPFIRYQETVSRNQELSHSKEVYRSVNEVIGNILDDIRATKRPDIPQIKKAITPMVDSVLRNPDAFMWLAMLKKKDQYSYHHTLSASVLATNFGRTLGLSKIELSNLAMGALLYDVGKARLPGELLSKSSRLTPAEFDFVKSHVEIGVKLLKGVDGMNQEMLDMVYCHHERHDGSGYPRGLRENEIPPYGKIAAIVDCYDAIISARPYATAVSPHQAISMLYEWRDMAFQSVLVEQFIQSIGIFPTGTLVELSTGQVGVVIAQNRIRRLRPRIMLILDEHKNRYGHFPLIDLISENEAGSSKPLEIVKGLEPGSYGIDANELYL